MSVICEKCKSCGKHSANILKVCPHCGVEK